jgi:hypothetical protein
LTPVLLEKKVVWQLLAAATGKWSSSTSITQRRALKKRMKTTRGRPKFERILLVRFCWWVVVALFVCLISHQPAVLFSQNKSSVSNQPTVLFFQNKSAPGISHQPPAIIQVVRMAACDLARY